MYLKKILLVANCQFLMVTGGWGGAVLDSTEIFSDNVWRTVAGKLLVPMYTIKEATINNRVLIFGILFYFRI